MFHNIVVPLDGSAQSKAAVALALRMACEDKASVTFAHAIEVTKIIAISAPSSIDPSYAIEAARTAGQEILSEARAAAEEVNLAVSTELVEGDCVAALLELAAQRGADLIVVGSHGRGGISRALLGSIAEGILRRSDIPVLVTHAPRKTQDASATSKAL